MAALADVLVLETAAAEAAERARKARAILQFHCAHEIVIESDTGPDKFYIRTPFRVCLDCGFAEHTWSCDNQILRNEPSEPHVPYNEAFKHTRGGAPRIHENAQFVGYYLDTRAVGGQVAYRRLALLRALKLTEADVASE